MNTPDSATRRRFLQDTAARTLAATWWLQSAGAQAVHSGEAEPLRCGLIGAGQRGTGSVVDALQADPQARLVAIADTFRDRAEGCLDDLMRYPEIAEQVDVKPDHVFVGFDAYRQLIDADVDVILLATPPHFRPGHLAYAVESGKHCFVEKPVAVDVPGVLSVQASCQSAEQKGLSIVSGLCYRYDDAVIETIRRIQDGAIGEIRAVESHYNTSTLWHRGDRPEWSRMEYQIRNWLYYTWLSGDHIVEQAVHSLDKVAWLLGDQNPLRASGMGGRQQRVQPEFGNIYDHHCVQYLFPNDVRVYFTCRQMARCSNFVDEIVIGTEGTARILAHEIDSKKSGKWKYDGPSVNMYLSEHQAFFRSIREGTPINNGHYMCNSTMLAILGRLCTYTGLDKTWDECLADTTRLGPQEYAWVDPPEPPVAVPGSFEA